MDLTHQPNDSAHKNWDPTSNIICSGSSNLSLRMLPLLFLIGFGTTELNSVRISSKDSINYDGSTWDGSTWDDLTWYDSTWDESSCSVINGPKNS